MENEKKKQNKIKRDKRKNNQRTKLIYLQFF